MSDNESSGSHDPNRTACGTEGKGFDMETWWEDRSLSQKIGLGIGFGLLGIAFLALLGLVVMLLWNWLMPDLLGVGRLTYWKAWGLLVLCWILFKSWGPGGSGNRTERQRKQQLRRLVREDQSSAGTAPAAGVESR